MSDHKYLDDFMNDVKESQFNMDAKMKEKILKKTHRKIRGRWFLIKNAFAACMILAVITSFIPSTPVYALRQRLFSFIPGIGVVENNEGTGVIKSVLAEPVKVSYGDEFVEIRTAYILDQTLNISIKSNVGVINKSEFKDPAQFKEFFSQESSPDIYLLNEKQKVKASFTVRSGPSYDTRVYTMNAGFHLDKGNGDKSNFEFQLDGFNKTVKISMSPVRSGIEPESVGNAAVLDNIMIFADTVRQDNVVEVLVSAVAPREYGNIRFHLYDWEKKGFKEGIHIVDEEGNVYEPDDELRRQNEGSRNMFYFDIPQDKKGLKLVVPQILYSRKYDNNDIKIDMPKIDKEVVINKEIDLGQNILLIEKASIVPANDPMLPEYFKAYECLRIDAAAKPKETSGERIVRALPVIEVPKGLFGSVRQSSSGYADLWELEDQGGYSISHFENMNKSKKIILKWDVECALTGPWVIEID